LALLPFKGKEKANSNGRWGGGVRTAAEAVQQHTITSLSEAKRQGGEVIPNNPT
jgi:hypothetical protein